MKKFRISCFGNLNNKGSTIITVLVAMALISVLGVILLFTSYTGFQMKVTERQSKRNFYEAETALNEIRAGIQLAVSDSIATANTKVLENYNSSAADSADNAFKDYFKQALFKWKPDDADPTKLLSSEVVLGSLYTGPAYDYGVLYGFISDGLNGYITLATDLSQYPSQWGKLEVSDELVTLKNMTVKCIKNGYETNITTDISVTVPDFSYTLPKLVLTSIQEYIIVADTELVQNSGNSLHMDGNVFAGKVRLNGNGNALLVGQGSDNTASGAYKFICAGTLSADTAADFILGSKSTVWANRIEVGTSSNVKLSGESYIADDLELKGETSAAVLAGRYFGFGNSLGESTQSSSIIINGRNTSLDLSGLNTLMLAGESFISSGTIDTGVPGQENKDIFTGESVSSKSNQLAYLIPGGCIENLKTNPVIFTNTQLQELGSSDTRNATLKGYVKTDVPLWEGGHTLSYYGAKVQLVYRPLTASSQTIVYYYMQFDTLNAASSYFKDYFQYNSEKIQHYMEFYSDMLSLSGTGDNLLAGNAVCYDETGKVSLIKPAAATFSDAAANLKTMFTNLCVTLSTSNPGTGTVFSNIVNTAAIESELGETTFFYSGGSDSTDVTGIITKVANSSLASFKAAYPNVKVFVTTGDITVDSEYSGLIIAKGTVDLRNSIYLDKNAVSTAMNATTSDGSKTLLDYLLIGSSNSTSYTSDQVTWDMNSLVFYQNWNKH